MSSFAPFEFVSSVDVVLPADYNHDEWLRQFMEKRGQEFVRPKSVYEKRASFMDEISVRLSPNQRLAADFYHIKESVSSCDCLAMVVDNDGLLLGTRGAALLCAHATSALPNDGVYFSFNNEENMPVISFPGESERCIPTLFSGEKPKLAFVYFDVQHDPKIGSHQYGVVVFRPK